MSIDRKLELVFTAAERQRLLRSVFLPSRAHSEIVNHFKESKESKASAQQRLHWGIQAASLCVCLIEYHLRSSSMEPYQFLEECHPHFFNSLWHLCNAPRQFIEIFGDLDGMPLEWNPTRTTDPLALFDRIFHDFRKAGRLRIEIVRNELAPGQIEIKRGEVVVPANELPVLINSIENQFTAFDQRDRAPWPWPNSFTRPILSDQLRQSDANAASKWITIGMEEWFGTVADSRVCCARAERGSRNIQTTPSRAAFTCG